VIGLLTIQYTCFGAASIQIHRLHNVEQWQRLLQELPSYLDEKHYCAIFLVLIYPAALGLNAAIC